VSIPAHPDASTPGPHEQQQHSALASLGLGMVALALTVGFLTCLSFLMSRVG
jgi:hypothetical protein